MRRINLARKKAEMSLTVVVSAVIALVVLIVLIYIFTNSSQKSSKTFANCALNGGTCKSGTSNQVCGTAGALDGASCGEGFICCVRSDWFCDKNDAGECCASNQIVKGGNCVDKPAPTP